MFLLFGMCSAKKPINCVLCLTYKSNYKKPVWNGSTQINRKDKRAKDWYFHPCSSFLNLCSLIPQGISSDIVRYFAFFSYFTIQLAQLFLCCFADKPAEGKKLLEKVGVGERIPLPSETSTPICYLGKETSVVKMFSLLQEMMCFTLFLPSALTTPLWLPSANVCVCGCSSAYHRHDSFTTAPDNIRTAAVTMQQQRPYSIHISPSQQIWTPWHSSSK